MRPNPPQWKIELRASTYPVEEWLELRSPRGRWLRFVDRSAAEDTLARLQRVQPHLVARIAPLPLR